MAIALPSVRGDRISLVDETTKNAQPCQRCQLNRMQNGKNADRTVGRGNCTVSERFQPRRSTYDQRRLFGRGGLPRYRRFGRKSLRNCKEALSASFHLTEELVRQGHEGDVVCQRGDSVTKAKLEACQQALRLNTGIFNREAPLIQMMEQVFAAADQFDLIHSHL